MRCFELDVTLPWWGPPPWRRLQLPADTTFLALHHAIQDACDWEDDHLFRFTDRQDRSIAGEGGGGFDLEPDPDPAAVRLSSFFPRRRKCTYLYDFGDSWEHDVALVRTFDAPERFTRPLVNGGLAFPPEDCGGLWGYADCIDIALGGDDPHGRREWLGDWQPDAFDLAAARQGFDC